MAGELGDLVMKVSADVEGYKRDMAEASQAAQQHAAVAAQSFGASGMSAKQYAFALRGVPAQFTDIFVSLQGGQKPLTVLLQQGGQLKDMFGGIVPAFRAMGGYIASVINPATLAIAAISGIGYAVYEARSQIASLSGAAAKNGGILGITPDEIAAIADRVGELTGKFSAASSAALALAESGRFGPEIIETAMQGVVDMATVTGQSVEKVVEEFVSLSNDPLGAIQKLNDQYNFLTLDVYKQIEALVEQGDTTGAVRKAIESLGDTMHERAGKMIENLGWIQSAWKGLTKTINESWAALLRWGRQETVTEKIAQYEAGLKSARDAYNSGRNTTDSLKQNIEGMEQTLSILKKQSAETEINTKARAANAKANREQIAAYKDYKSYVENGKRSTRSTQVQQENDEFAKATRGLKKGSAEYTEALEAHHRKLAAIQKKFSGKAGKSDAFASSFDSMKSSASGIEFAIDNFNRFEGKVRSSKEATAQFDVTLGKFSDTARRKAKLPVLSGQQKADYIAEGRYLDTLNEKLRQINVIKNFKKDAREFGDKQAVSLSDMAFETESYGKTKRELEKLTATRKIDLETQEMIQKVNRDIGEKGLILTQEQISAHERNIEALKNEADVAKQSAMAQLEYRYSVENDPWINMKKSLDDYRESAENTGKQVGDAITNSMKSAEDAIVQFATTGKLSFGDFVQSVLSGLVRIQAQKMVSGLANGLTSVLGSVLGGAFEYNFGDGPGSAYAYNEIFGGARAKGGPVSSNKTYLVGERGPELFVPNNSGSIVPNDALGGSRKMSIQINHRNEGTKQEVSSSNADFEGNTMVINIVTRDIENDGPVSRAIMRNFGASRAAGAY